MVAVQKVGQKQDVGASEGAGSLDNISQSLQQKGLDEDIKTNEAALKAAIEAISEPHDLVVSAGT